MGGDRALSIEGGVLGLKNDEEFVALTNFSFKVLHFVGDRDIGKYRPIFTEIILYINNCCIMLYSFKMTIKLTLCLYGKYYVGPKKLFYCIIFMQNDY